LDSILEPSISRPTDEELEQFMRNNQDETKLIRIVKEGGMKLMSLLLNKDQAQSSKFLSITRTLCTFQCNSRRHEKMPVMKN